MDCKTITHDQAKELAFRYAAFKTANHEGDDQGRLVWGQMLKEYQQMTGITLVVEERLDFWINKHRSNTTNL